MQYAPRLPHPTRAIVVPLMAATLGAGVATATFAVVNIEDDPSLSLPTPAVQSAPPSDAVAGQRNDGGPAEGTAQQTMSPASDLRDSKESATVDTAPRYDGGPNEGVSASTIAQPTAPRYDGGPNEGVSASTIAQPAAQSPPPEAFSGTRP